MERFEASQLDRECCFAMPADCATRRAFARRIAVDECINKRRGETSSVEAGQHRLNASRDAIDGSSSSRTSFGCVISKWLKHDWMSSIAREQRCDIGSK
ncbi:hypothetical protein [Bradyrhizobium sp. AUGA SZCCT0042]|uniref:hypothetical protein n=1 Tax=Bradyrhizobium sp. AUGA SZCCT0042 TaxID=2807651 RepID=UPI001BA527A7|nr:hypothetical protein [Bradyrhizobium sp. AUGA SZCCT0042]